MCHKMIIYVHVCNILLVAIVRNYTYIYIYIYIYKTYSVYKGCISDDSVEALEDEDEMIQGN